MFPLAFPERELADAGPEDVVLDPFCGRGTTLFAGRLKGLPAYGVDTDAVAVAIARSKLVCVTPPQVLQRFDSLLAQVLMPTNVPKGVFWELAFAESTLVEICRVREALLTAETAAEDDALRALLMGILHGPTSAKVPNYLSNRMLRTYATKPDPAVAYWNKHKLKPRAVHVRAALARRAEYVLLKAPAAAPGHVVHGDSRNLGSMDLPQNVSRVITSPPYLGMRTYRPDQWLRHWFLGGPPTVEYGMGDSLPPAPQDDFQDGLAKVWKAVASVSRPGARLSIRFGSLPSVRADPELIVRASLAAANAGWEVLSVASAGLSTHGKRQATAMRTKSAATDEIDLRARLVA